MALQSPTMGSAGPQPETKQERLDRLYKQLRQIGEWDADDMEWLLDEVNKDRAVLRSCLSKLRDNSPEADRLRARLGVDDKGQELRNQTRE